MNLLHLLSLPSFEVNKPKGQPYQAVRKCLQDERGIRSSDDTRTAAYWTHTFSFPARDCYLILFYFILFVTPFFIYTLAGNLGRSTWTRKKQPQEMRYPVLQVHAGSVRVSVIHRTLTWTTWSLTYICVLDHSYACVYTRGVGNTDNESVQHFWLETNSHNVLFVFPGGVRTRVTA